MNSTQPEVLGNETSGHVLAGNNCPEGDPTRTASGNMVTSVTSARQLTGFQANGGQISREDLIEQGLPSAQADALVVRQHQEEVFVQHFRCWICCFIMIVSILTPAMFCILVWMVVTFFDNQDVDCDVPLQTWVYVVIIIVVFNSTVNRPSVNGSPVQRLFCQWTPDPNSPQPVPWRVRIYNLLVTVFVFGWNCTGVYWTAVDGSRNVGEPCKEAAPGLYRSVQVYAYFNLAFTIFMYINMVGVNQLLRVAVRRGLLRTSDAAPSGSLEKNTEEITMNDPLISSSPNCSICLEDFDESAAICKTRKCSHCFHKSCLKGWLQVNRTCPLCREDLGV